MFASDLVRAVEPCPRGTTLDFIRASSYGSATESSGEVQLKTDLNPAKVKGRHVLLVRGGARVLSLRGCVPAVTG